jgi:hypothetical protein
VEFDRWADTVTQPMARCLDDGPRKACKSEQMLAVEESIDKFRAASADEDPAGASTTADLT